MSKAADLASLASASETALSNRNIVINGSFDVWQRGTSFSNANNVYTADRFKVVSGGGTTGDTVSRQAFAAGQTDVPGNPTYYLRYAAGSTSSNKVMQHRIEDVRNGAGETCTLSFYAKASTSHTSTAEVAQVFGSGGSSQVTQSPQNYAMTTSWQKFTFTISLPSISGKTIGTSSYIYIAFIRSLPLANTSIDIAQMQFEVGSVATPFNHRSYGEELALCQRYCTVYNTNGEGDIPMSSAQVDLANRPEILLFYPKKRADPSIAVVNPTNFKVLTAANTAIACSGYGGTYLGTGSDSAVMFWTVSSGVATNSLSGIIQQLLIFQNTGSITIDAEL